MKKSELILEVIAKNTIKNNNEWKHEQLYRQLYNEDFYFLAYDLIKNNSGSIISGIDDKTIDGFNKNIIYELIEELKTEKYKPKPIKIIKNKKKSIGIPTIKDRLLQKVCQLILESIYEPIMSKYSHGFRPDKSCHTALNQLINSSTGIKWWIEGDIENYFNSINHNILIEILRKKINDERFLNLIRKFLNAGVMKDFISENTYSGISIGGILSPILSNIYLNEFDKYMEDYQKSFNSGKYRKANPEYTKLRYQKQQKEKLLKENPNINNKDDIINEIKTIKFKMRHLSSGNPIDKNFKRFIFVRYADDWLVGVIGSKADCEKIKLDIQNFLTNQLNLKLSDKKTKITNAKDSIRYLGYQIKKYKNTDDVIDKNKKRQISEKFGLYINIEQCRDFFLKNKMMEIKNNTFKSKGLPFLSIKDDLEIINHYNGLLRGYYNYYSLANNIYILNQFQFIFEESFIKTMAHKYKSSKYKMYRKYKKNKKIKVKYKNSKGEVKFVELYHEGFAKKRVNNKNEIDIKFNPLKYATRTSMSQRLQANKCELCGKTEGNFEIHHINKMKNIKNGKSQWEKLMIARKRKTIVVCEECHLKIHGKKKKQ